MESTTDVGHGLEVTVPRLGVSTVDGSDFDVYSDSVEDESSLPRFCCCTGTGGFGDGGECNDSKFDVGCLIS